MRIRDLGWKKLGSGMEKVGAGIRKTSRIRNNAFTGCFVHEKRTLPPIVLYPLPSSQQRAR